MKQKIYGVINVVLLSMMLVSCDWCENETILGIGSGGDFTVINMGTNDTIEVSGAISFGFKEITAHNGDIIKIKFEQNGIYKNYSFNTEYTFPNDFIVKNQPEYEYVVGDTLSGTYDVSLSAWSSGKSHGDTWDITASGAFTLKVE